MMSCALCSAMRCSFSYIVVNSRLLYQTAAWICVACNECSVRELGSSWNIRWQSLPSPMTSQPRMPVASSLPELHRRCKTPKRRHETRRPTNAPTSAASLPAVRLHHTKAHESPRVRVRIRTRGTRSSEATRARQCRSTTEHYSKHHDHGQAAAGVGGWRRWERGLVG